MLTGRRVIEYGLQELPTASRGLNKSIKTLCEIVRVEYWGVKIVHLVLTPSPATVPPSLTCVLSSFASFSVCFLPFLPRFLLPLPCSLLLPLNLFVFWFERIRGRLHEQDCEAPLASSAACSLDEAGQLPRELTLHDDINIWCVTSLLKYMLNVLHIMFRSTRTYHARSVWDEDPELPTTEIYHGLSTILGSMDGVVWAYDVVEVLE